MVSALCRRAPYVGALRLASTLRNAALPTTESFKAQRKEPKPRRLLPTTGTASSGTETQRLSISSVEEMGAQSTKNSSSIPIEGVASTGLFTEKDLRLIAQQLKEQLKYDSTGIVKIGIERRKEANMTASGQENTRPVISKEEADAAAFVQKKFVYVAIDGDSAVFNIDLIVLRRRGGWKAAEVLLREIKKIVNVHEDPAMDIVVQLFINRNGFSKWLWGIHKVHRDASEDFLEGFNEADPLVNIISVGSGKEAADAKLREGIRFHLSLRECQKVVFAGMTDAGYASSFRSLMTRGMARRIVLLNTSQPLARELAEIVKTGEAPSSRPGDSDSRLDFVPMPEGLFMPMARPLSNKQ